MYLVSVCRVYVHAQKEIILSPAFDSSIRAKILQCHGGDKINEVHILNVNTYVYYLSIYAFVIAPIFHLEFMLEFMLRS